MGIRIPSNLYPLTALLALVLLFPSFCEADVFLWPQPQSIAWNEGGPEIVIASHFVINAAQKHPELSAAVKRYTKLVQKERWLPVQVATSFDFEDGAAGSLEGNVLDDNTLSSLNVSVSDLAADLQHGVDESYTIVVDASPTRASLTAATVWGAMRGLETFSQLIRLSTATPNSPLVIESGVEIHDRPLFPHRGVLLDLSRNFFPVTDLKRTIRALSYNKLNVLHLHISDAHSFPLELESEPDLARKGSYGTQYTYTPRDIRSLVQYGRNYGVRLVPEIDTPGHTASWGGAHPQIITCRNQFWCPPGTSWGDRLASEPGTGQLNPLLSKTYEVVDNVINEVASLFTDDFYHAGGDELAPNCWMQDGLVKEYMAGGANRSLSDLLTTFIDKTRHTIDGHKKTVVYWEDLMLDGAVNVSASHLPKETTILQTWNNGPNNTKAITSAGYRAIVSSVDFYYLDCGHGGFLGNDLRYDQNFNDDPNNTFNYGGLGGSYCAPFKTWARIYDYDITADLTAEEAALVLGGEVALWSEQADTTVLDGRLWPRSSALAETLWSGNRESANSTVKRYAEAINRLNDWRLRLVHRGIMAEPLQPLWCLKNPGMCNFSPV